MKSIFSPTLLNEKSGDKFSAKVMPKVGMILVSTWGYGQTNADFYVVSKVNPSSVEICPIESKETPTGNDGMFGTAVAVRNGRTGKPMVKKLRLDVERDSFYLKLNSYSSAWAWNGSPINVSHTN